MAVLPLAGSTIRAPGEILLPIYLEKNIAIIYIKRLYIKVID